MTAPPLPGSLIDLFLEWAGRQPHAPALIDGEQVYSYRALEIASRRAALAVTAAGWRAGDVVGAAFGAMPFSLGVVAILGLGRAGIALLPLSAHEAGSDEAAAVLRHFGAVGLLAAEAPAAAPGVPVRLVDAGWLAAAGPPAAFAGPALPSLCLAVGRSSGTTGTPKAFAITHAQEAARMVLQAVPAQAGPGDRDMTLAGLGFLTGIRCVLRCLGSGAALVALPREPGSRAALSMIDRSGVSHILGSPVHLRWMLAALPGGPPAAPRLPRLKVWRIGGSILSPALLAEARAGLTPAIHCSYGTNEAGSLTCATPGMLARHPTTIGRIYPGIEIALRDAAGHSVPAGQPGQVWVRSPGVVTGYLSATEREAARFRDGWFDTGDIASIDAEGLVFLHGRADELMNFNGILVAPRDIEAAFDGHPLVAEVVAFALPSELHQDVPCIAVVPRGVRDTQALLAHGRERLGPKAPRAVMWVKAMPRSAAGKELRRELAALAERNRKA